MKIFQKISWKPVTVSWLSFVLMGVIVAGVGLAGTAHVIEYLQEQIVEHGIEHNQEIAIELTQKIERSYLENKADISSILSHAIEDYQAFGYQIFLINQGEKTLIFDNSQNKQTIVPLSSSWLADAKKLDGESLQTPLTRGAIRVISKNNHPLLIWIHEVRLGSDSNYFLGVAKDEIALSEFLSDLHLHLDAVLLVTYLLIAILGYFTLRSIGRSYEKRLESQLDLRTQELEKAHEDVLLKTRLATIGQTASVLTHEMRNPLASIKLALSGLKGGDYLHEREMRRVDLVLGEVDRLDNMLSETLDYVRPVKISDEPVDLDHLLNKVMHQEKPLMDEKKLRLNYLGCADCTVLQIDEGQIYQVLLNLLKNSIEASPEGEVISIQLARSKGDVLQITIINKSDSLAEETIQRVFEPFYTTKPKGTGLGMGLVKRVIDEHRGNITFSLNDDNSVIVEIQLPRNQS